FSFYFYLQNCISLCLLKYFLFNYLYFHIHILSIVTSGNNVTTSIFSSLIYISLFVFYLSLFLFISLLSSILISIYFFIHFSVFWSQTALLRAPNISLPHVTNGPFKGL